MWKGLEIFIYRWYERTDFVGCMFWCMPSILYIWLSSLSGVFWLLFGVFANVAILWMSEKDYGWSWKKYQHNQSNSINCLITWSMRYQADNWEAHTRTHTHTQAIWPFYQPSPPPPPTHISEPHPQLFFLLFPHSQPQSTINPHWWLIDQ